MKKFLNEIEHFIIGFIFLTALITTSGFIISHHEFVKSHPIILSINYSFVLMFFITAFICLIKLGKLITEQNDDEEDYY